MKIVTNNFKETKKFGNDFSKKLKLGDVLLLFGDLGAGKTTFTQGLAQGMGIKDRILSPTFVLQRVHDIPGKKKVLNHIDLYRIEEPTMIDNLGLAEIIEDKNSITIIEWADRLKNYSPKKGYKLYFKYLGGDKREIKIEKL